MFDGQADPVVEAIAALTRALGAAPPASDDATRIDRIRALEDAAGVLAAARAEETAAFVRSQRAAQREAGVPADRVGRGVAAQVALARRISPHQASRYVSWCMVLTTELPGTYAALRAGRISESRALLVARETIWLSRDDRAQVDVELASRIHTLGERKLEAEVRRLAYRLDPAGYVARVRSVEDERHVSLRPAPDAMTRLTALLPVAQGVVVYAALGREADSARCDGDERGRGQVMADTLVERVTGQTTAAEVPVEVNLIMTSGALLSGEPEPAVVVGQGVPAMVIPAHVARRAAADPSGDTDVFIRRLYTSPTTGELIAMDATARRFTTAQRRFLLVRDQLCRTPWCGAPIRHADHVLPAEVGGATHIDNGAGLCEACNYAKQAPGWRSRRVGEQIQITTPTGHSYRSSPPRPPGRRRATHGHRSYAVEFLFPPLPGQRHAA